MRCTSHQHPNHCTELVRGYTAPNVRTIRILQNTHAQKKPTPLRAGFRLLHQYPPHSNTSDPSSSEREKPVRLEASEFAACCSRIWPCNSPKRSTRQVGSSTKVVRKLRPNRPPCVLPENPHHPVCSKQPRQRETGPPPARLSHPA